jgi:hypothetical protein
MSGSSSSSYDSGAAGSTTASTDNAGAKGKKKQVARNDARCDESANAGRALPKDCASRSDAGAAGSSSAR